MDLHVSPAVLIPRPETEQLVETAVSRAKKRGSVHVVDAGTGSGCIPIVLARNLPQAHIEATDISANALVIAQQNAAEFAPNRITFHLGNLLQPITEPIDLITANLPYVTDHEWTMLDDGVKLYEPQLALKGGPDGLDIIKDLLNQATHKLTSGGAILLEIGWQQGQAAQALAASIFPAAQIELLQDYFGRDRFVTIQTCGRLWENRLENNTAATQRLNTRHILTSETNAIAEMAVFLHQGELVVFPTDTVYGVGVDAFNAPAILKLYAVKQRTLDKGIPILLADLDDIAKVATAIPAAAQVAIAAFWPGPLTVIVPKHPSLPECISPNEGIALRIPANDAARALIRAVGGALATSSANLSGHPPACNGATAFAELQGRIAAVLDDGPTPGDTPSTIVSYLGPQPVILREGPITAKQLSQAGANTL